MFIEMKIFIVKEGILNIVVECFIGEGIIEKFEGFIDLSVFVKKVRCGDEEVVVMICWEFEEVWKNWEISEEYLVGYRVGCGKLKLDYIINVDYVVYYVKLLKVVY